MTVDLIVIQIVAGLIGMAIVLIPYTIIYLLINNNRGWFE